MNRAKRLEVLRNLRDVLEMDRTRRTICSHLSEDWFVEAAKGIMAVTSRASVSRAAIERIFEVWLDTLPKKGRTRILTPKRSKLISTRLSQYGVEDVMLAVQGWTRDPWEGRVNFCDITILLRTPESTEKFRDLMAEAIEQTLKHQNPSGPEDGAYNLDRTHRWSLARGSYVPAGEWSPSE